MREKSSVVILSRGDKVLLIKRKNSVLWDLPWSRVGVGETSQQAALRISKQLVTAPLNVNHLVANYELSLSKNQQLVYAMSQSPDEIAQFSNGQARYFHAENLPKNLHKYRKHQIESFHRGLHEKQYSIGESPLLFVFDQAAYFLRRKK